MHEYARYTIRHVLFLFNRGCVCDCSHRSIRISAYTVFYESPFHLVFICSQALIATPSPKVAKDPLSSVATSDLF